MTNVRHIAELMDRLDPMAQHYQSSSEDDTSLTPIQLKIAKRFVELMGGADKARVAVDKVDECEECLGIIDDDEDDANIERMSDMIPNMPDLPTGLSGMYNPTSIGNMT